MKKFIVTLLAIIPMALYANTASESKSSYVDIAIEIAIGIAIFLAIRYFICWYFKLNKIVENQEEIRILLAAIAASVSAHKNEEEEKQVNQS